MKIAPLFCLALAAAALAGCYESQALLLDAGQAVQPLATGDFQNVGEPGDNVTVRLGADHWYAVTGKGPKDKAPGETQRLLFNVLPGGDQRRFVFANDLKGAFIYGLARRDADGKVYFNVPFCGDTPARDAAAKAGAAMGTKKALGPTCTFATRASLLDALQRFAALPPPSQSGGDPQPGLPGAP